MNWLDYLKKATKSISKGNHEEARSFIEKILDEQEKEKNRRVIKLDCHIYLPQDVDMVTFTSEFYAFIESKGGMCPSVFIDITDKV